MRLQFPLHVDGRLAIPLAKPKMFCLWLCVMACTAWPAPVSGARSDAITLFGLEGFRVEIAAVSLPARRLGFSKTRLRNLAFTHLRRNALIAGDFPATLTISLRVVEHPAAVLAYSLELQVQQVVRLKRTEQVHLVAPTWTEGTLSMVPRTGLVRSVESALSALFDALARDYRLVN
mgnify:CR=1 FL=1